MTARTYLLAALLGGAVLFLWGGLTHAVLPTGGMKEFRDSSAVVATLRANTDERAIYFATQGVFAAVDLAAGDRSQAMGKHLAIEYVADVAIALVLTWLLARMPVRGTLDHASAAAVLGLLATMVFMLPYWNWYGFPAAFAVGEAFDNVGGFFLAGLLIAALRRTPEPAPAITG